LEPQNCGRYGQVVAIRRWSLAQVWLYLHFVLVQNWRKLFRSKKQHWIGLWQTSNYFVTKLRCYNCCSPLKSEQSLIKDNLKQCNRGVVQTSSTDRPLIHSVARELEAIADPHPKVLNLASMIFPFSSTSICQKKLELVHFQIHLTGVKLLVLFEVSTLSKNICPWILRTSTVYR